MTTDQLLALFELRRFCAVVARGNGNTLLRVASQSGDAEAIRLARQVQTDLAALSRYADRVLNRTETDTREVQP